MNKRKIKIGVVTFACVLVGFGIYNLIVDTPPIILDNQSQDGEGLEIPDFGEGTSQFGDYKVGDPGPSYFTKLDEKTKKVRRILSFESLKDPLKGTDMHRLEKPHMQIMGDNFECDIQSDRGRISFETVLEDVSPSMAELNDNVKIVIHTKKDNKKITVSLDDLIYDDERCEFASEGPVKVEGDDGVMEGTGLIMIYDPQLGKLAYLEIRKLDYLRIKNAAKNNKSSSGADDENESDKNVAKDTESNADKSPAKDTALGANKNMAKDIKANNGEKYKYYECRLLDNVNIEYGKRLVIVDADEVTISNILWSEDDEDIDKDGEKKTDSPAAASSDVASQNLPADVAPKVDTKSADAADENEDVYVTCKGSLIVRPMEMAGVRPGYLSRDTVRKMEFTGRPVRIGQLIHKNSKDIEPVASCGAMTYDLDQEVLDLVTNDTERYVELNMRENEANIYTKGSVKWNRRDNNAVITGPGVLLVDETAKTGKTSDMKFDGSMNIFFAEKGPKDFGHRLSLSSVNLIGGMVANLNAEGNTTVKSDLANFYFGGGQDITQIDLNGNVDMSSDKGGLKSDNAKIFFEVDGAGENVPMRVSGSGNAVLEPKQISSTRPIRFHSKKIDYDMLTGSAIASGPVKFIFYEPDKEDATPEELKKDKPPIIITAEENAKFYPEQKQFVFNGDVVGTKRIEHQGFVQKEDLYGDKLIVDLGPSKKDKTKDDIKHIRVVGGLVELQSKRTAGDVIVSHVGLTCMQLDWDDDTDVILAAGPGNIQINNENAPEPVKDKEDSDLDLEGPCVANITGFQSLTWSIQNHTIITDGGNGAVNIGYFPIKDGKRGQIVKATSRYITSHYVETTEGKFDLVSLATKGGIVYQEEGSQGRRTMTGDTMHYNGTDGLMVIRGDDCKVNGAPMSLIEYNMKTGRIRSKLSSKPGTIGVE